MLLGWKDVSQAEANRRLTRQPHGDRLSSAAARAEGRERVTRVGQHSSAAAVEAGAEAVDREARSIKEGKEAMQPQLLLQQQQERRAGKEETEERMAPAVAVTLAVALVARSR